MNNEQIELWEAMKDAKYRKTLLELESVEVDETTDMADFMNAILDIVARAVHAEVGTLWYYSKFADGRIHPKAQFGGSDMGDFSLAPGEGIAGSVIKTGKGVIIQDCQKDPRWSGKVDAGTGFITRSMICVPLRDGDMGFGCIQLINRTDGNLYDEKDLAFGENLGMEIADIFIRHSKDLFMGYFSAFETKDNSGLNAIMAIDDRKEMMRNITRMPAYLKLKGLKARRFARCCRILWDLTHEKQK